MIDNVQLLIKVAEVPRRAVLIENFFAVLFLLTFFKNIADYGGKEVV
jgi:hypothetical protein